MEVLEVLKMQNASESDIKHFEEDLMAALKSYEYYGKSDAPNGIVDVYIDKSSDGIVGELSAEKLLQVYHNGL